MARAVKSMTTAQPEPAPKPATQEPPVAEPAAPPSEEPLAPTPETPPAKTEDEDEHENEVPAEEQAAWTDGEKRLYGALVKERAARKEAKKELKDLGTKFQELETKLATPKEPEVPAPNENASPLPTTAGPLAECRTFEAVDATVAEASRVELLTYDLQQKLGRDEREPVIAALAAEGVKTINGVPLAEADARALGDFLSNAYKGTRVTQTQAQGRKEFLKNEELSLGNAVKLLPGLADVKSEEFKTFKAIADRNPAIKNFGPNWPTVLAQYIRGATQATPAAGAPQPPQPPQPAPTIPKVEIVPPAPTRKAPGAPGKTGAALPQTTDVDAARARVKDGTASMADVQLLAKHSLTTDANAPAAVR